MRLRAGNNTFVITPDGGAPVKRDRRVALPPGTDKCDPRHGVTCLIVTFRRPAQAD